MFPASFAGVLICVCMFSVCGWFLNLSVSFARLFAPMVSGSGHFASVGRVLMVPGTIVGITLQFDMFRVSVQALDTSISPCDPSVWPPRPFGSSACQCTLARCTCSISPLRGVSDSMDMVMSVLGSFGVHASFWGIDCPLELYVGLTAAPLSLSPSSGSLCHLGKLIIGFRCLFECCAWAFACPFGRGLYQVDLH